jgi:hypothetical protein
MSPPAAFVMLGASSFTGALPARPAAAVCSAPRRTAAAPVAMAKFSIPNPFAKKPNGDVAPSGFAQPQPGDQDYVAPREWPTTRGLDLLREDVLKSAPEVIGVGRQDYSGIMEPQFGEPGYKPQAYEETKVSELGISPFQDDANAVGKVGGLAAVQQAAIKARMGVTAEAIKDQIMNKPMVVREEDMVYDIPSYLKPLPEDTPRKGLTWKNYNGR